MRTPRVRFGSMLVSCIVLSILSTIAVLAPLGAAERVAQQQSNQQADFEHIAALDELTDAHARVLRLYWAYFEREPDAAGAMYWIDQLEQCRALGSIAAFFTDSPEFVRTYGQLDNTPFIRLVYRNVLDRDPDTTGLAFWTDQLEGDHIDRTRLMLDFSFSPEFVARRPLPSDGVAGRPCAAGVTPSATPQRYDLQDWEPFATVGPVTLTHPSAAVAIIGFHESTHDGAQQQAPTETATDQFTMDSRGRGTPSRSAADIAVHPMFEIRSPVTGTVLRAGSYVLYCKHSDDFFVVEPDDRPGWEVKVLHISGVQVEPGDRVIAGETVVAPRTTLFPFRSQIDAATAEPSWGHVHIEVVDPSIPDRPSNSTC